MGESIFRALLIALVVVVGFVSQPAASQEKTYKSPFDSASAAEAPPLGKYDLIRNDGTPLVTPKQTAGPEESLIRGAVQGAMFLVIGYVLYLIVRLFKSPSEGARRIRWVLGAGAVLFVLALIGDAGGLSAVAISLVALGVCYWVYQGFKSKP